MGDGQEIASTFATGSGNRFRVCLWVHRSCTSPSLHSIGLARGQSVGNRAGSHVDGSSTIRRRPSPDRSCSDRPRQRCVRTAQRDRRPPGSAASLGTAPWFGADPDNGAACRWPDQTALPGRLCMRPRRHDLSLGASRRPRIAGLGPQVHIAFVRKYERLAMPILCGAI
jgi:hypothetical protein